MSFTLFNMLIVHKCPGMVAADKFEDFLWQFWDEPNSNKLTSMQNLRTISIGIGVCPLLAPIYVERFLAIFDHLEKIVVEFVLYDYNSLEDGLVEQMIDPINTLVKSTGKLSTVPSYGNFEEWFWDVNRGSHRTTRSDLILWQSRMLLEAIIISLIAWNFGTRKGTQG